MAEFALFAAGCGVGMMMTLPAVMAAGLLSGVISVVLHVSGDRVTVRETETPEQRRERMQAEYAEASGRG